MSDETKAAIEAAIVAHLRSEEGLDEGELLTEWLILASALPVTRTKTSNEVIFVVSSPGMLSHHGRGLAFMYLHELVDVKDNDEPLD